MQTKKPSYWNRPFKRLVDATLMVDSLRSLFLRWAESKLYTVLVENDTSLRPFEAKMDRYYMVRAILRSLNRALDSGVISYHVRDVIFQNFIKNVLLGDVGRRDAYRERYGFAPPTFITISPYKGCNLRCTGCYADSGATFRNTLEWTYLDRVIHDAKELWGMRFFVISGGEPLLYRSEGKTLLDVFAAHPDSYFMFYTNGTLIDKQVARRLAELGNATPAISVEGFREETDRRRGKGVFAKILQAHENLYEVGVPVGFSATVTPENWNLVVSDEFIDFYFRHLHCVYGWMFQYLPIGRGATVQLQPTPEQRLIMFRRQRQYIRQGYFITDFWNCGVITQGCISAGRPGGYFYITWDGDVTPCVFVPYSTHNIKEIYGRGGDLNEALHAPFLAMVRRWQEAYSYRPKSPSKLGNQIRQCAIRDHYRMYRTLIRRYGARPIDPTAAEALQDEDYYRGMLAYDKRFQELADPVWEREYLEPERWRRELAAA